ncbi:MAG: YdeI/OmpD-associated family protein [Mucilaginibacter sp.]
MSSLTQKLLIKPGKSWLVINPIDGYFTLLEPIPEGATITAEPEGDFDGIHLFVKNSDELTAALMVVTPLLKPDTIFWVSYPKKSSGIAGDLKMGTWQQIYDLGWQGVASMAVDDTWAGSRFRPVGQSKLSGMANEQIKENDYSLYVDVERKIITLPPDVKELLSQTPQALAFYEQLSYSNRKEYVLWILTAKQEKTRQERLTKTIEKLLAGKKNPTEK